MPSRKIFRALVPKSPPCTATALAPENRKSVSVWDDGSRCRGRASGFQLPTTDDEVSLEPARVAEINQA